MPEMTEENYKMLLERLDIMEKRQGELEKNNQDLVAMNRALLTGSNKPVIDKEERLKELGKKLKEGL